VKVSVVQEGIAGPALGQARPIPEGITFLDQAGAMLPFSGANAGGGLGGTTVTYAFITGAASARHPASLRWELTTQTKAIEVAFELHNLDLPIARPPPRQPIEVIHARRCSREGRRCRMRLGQRAVFLAGRRYPILDIAACCDLDMNLAAARSSQFAIPRACTVAQLLADPRSRSSSISPTPVLTLH